MTVDRLIDNLTMLKVHGVITGDTEIGFADAHKYLPINAIFNSLYNDKACLTYCEEKE